MVDLSIIIVSFNTKELSENCLKSIVKYTGGISYEIIIIDNNSKDDSVEMFEILSKTYPITLIKNKTNAGFGRANNQGLKIAKGRYFLLLNTDTKIGDNVLGEMVAWMDKHPRVGISTCSLKNKDGSIQGTGGYFPTLGRVFAWMFFVEDIPFLSKFIGPYHPMHPASPFYKGEDFFIKAHQRDWVTGAYLLLKRQVFKDVGFFDDDYFMYVEEVDYCFRAKNKGWQVWFLPRWSITHYGGASGTSENSLLSEYKGIKIFYKKHLPKRQFFFMRLFLKMGALLRVVIFGLIKGKEIAKIYVKAFQGA
jgi:GT2 family glycosyltransferase